MEKETYLMTGGTGFLGTLLSNQLIKDGFEIIFLSRQKNEVRAKKRIEYSLRELNPNINLENIYVLDINIFDKNLGLSDKEINLIKNKNPIGIWHLMANLSFKGKDRRDVFDTNFRSMENILNLASEIESPVLFTSTAYIHGKNKGYLKEDGLHKPKQFNNPYEESKFRAESMILEWHQKNLRNNFIIFRPSLLVEREKTIFNLSGYYVVVASLYRMKNNLKKFSKEHPLLSKLLGIKIDNNILKTKIPFVYSKKGCLNLMPVDIAIEWMLEIAKDKKSYNKTYHIINPNPFQMKDVLDNTFSALKISFPSFPSNNTFVQIYIYLMKTLGIFIKSLRGFSAKLNYYKFYMAEDRVFEIKNSRHLKNYKKYVNLKLNAPFIKDVASSFIKKLD